MMSTATPLVVVARWRVAEEQLDAVLALVAQLGVRSRAEPGCLGYDVMQGMDEPTTLVLVERYADRAALDAHLNSEHYQGLVAGQIRPLLTDREVVLTRPLGMD